MTKADKLHQLTSLRFFAAAMVVIHHSVNVFGFSGTNEPTVFGSGVSFFFVLSGFILAYVYPSLPSQKEVCRFLRARLARIWPVHAATFLLAWWLLSLEWETPRALANLALVHAWIPLPSYYFSYNAPSWSISTEFFFYLSFPIIIFRWSKTWLWKITLSGGLVIWTLLYSPETVFWNHEAWLYINPISRIFEFLFGAAIALAYVRRRTAVAWGVGLATTIELGALLLCAFGLYLKYLFSGYLPWGSAFAQWFDGSGLFVLFGILIYVIALGRGLLSRLLTRPGFVFLGEISFSIYLVHQIFIRYYAELLPHLPPMSGIMAFGLFCMAVILTSHILWVTVEMPMRRILVAPRVVFKDWKAKEWSQKINPSLWGAACSGLLLAGIVASLYPAIIQNGMSRAAYELSKGAAEGRPTVVAQALARGADPNGLGKDGVTPLVHAVWNGHLEVARVLVEAGADPNGYSNTGLSPLGAALDKGQFGIADYLLRKGAKAEWAGGNATAKQTEVIAINALVASISRGELSSVVTLMDWGIDPNSVDASGSTPLMHAAWKGREAIVGALLARGANPDGKSRSGVTPLMAAFQQGHWIVFELLLLKGADPNVQREDGATVLMDAVWQQNEFAIRKLLFHNANPTLKDRKGYSALDLARRVENSPILRLLGQWPG